MEQLKRDQVLFPSESKTCCVVSPTGLSVEDVTFSVAPRGANHCFFPLLLLVLFFLFFLLFFPPPNQLLELDMSFCGITRGDMITVRDRVGL